MEVNLFAAMEGKQKLEQAKNHCAYNSAIERSTVAMNGCDCDVSTHDAIGFSIVM